MNTTSTKRKTDGKKRSEKVTETKKKEVIYGSESDDELETKLKPKKITAEQLAKNKAKFIIEFSEIIGGNADHYPYRVDLDEAAKWMGSAKGAFKKTLLKTYKEDVDFIIMNIPPGKVGWVVITKK